MKKHTFSFFLFLVPISILVGLFWLFNHYHIEQKIEYHSYNQKKYEIVTYVFFGADILYSDYRYTNDIDSVKLIKHKTFIQAQQYLDFHKQEK